MSKYHDDNSFASNPGKLTLYHSYLSIFKNKLSLWGKIKSRINYPDEMIAEHLQSGDTRAAMVMQVKPSLRIAAYTDELDCIVILDFPLGFVKRYKLTVGSKLLTVNTYTRGDDLAADLCNGENSYHRYNNFYPLIAEFLTREKNIISELKGNIEDEEWERANSLGLEWIKNGTQPRNGSPYFSFYPCD